jgi:hypothetical protein
LTGTMWSTSGWRALLARDLHALDVGPRALPPLLPHGAGLCWAAGGHALPHQGTVLG